MTRELDIVVDIPASEKTEFPRVQTSAPEPKTYEVVLLDRSDKKSVVNLVPPEVSRNIEEMAFEHPEYLEVDERVLQKMLREKGCTLGATENRLRISFWQEYNRAQDFGVKMKMVNVYAGVCSKIYFMQKIVEKREKLAWLLVPPVAYTNAMEEALMFGLEKIRDVLDVKMYDAKGALIMKHAELVLRTVQWLDQRVKGAIVQKVDTRSLVMHGNMNNRPTNSEPLTMEAVQKQLAGLEAKARAMLDGAAQPGAIGVFPPEPLPDITVTAEPKKSE